jgi:hypothetical protein
MSRIILLVIVVAAGFWLYKNSAGGLLGSREKDATSTSSPVERARRVAATADDRQAETQRIASEEPTPREAGRVHENMTPTEVRTMLGAPDEVSTETTAAGGTREIWTYRNVGKRVVFEDGVAVSIQ